MAISGYRYPRSLSHLIIRLKSTSAVHILASTPTSGGFYDPPTFPKSEEIFAIFTHFVESATSPPMESQGCLFHNKSPRTEQMLVDDSTPQIIWRGFRETSHSLGKTVSLGIFAIIQGVF